MASSAVVQPCAKNCPKLCGELKDLARRRVEAQMATEVYNPMGQRHVPGYTEVTDPAELDKLDLDRSDLSPADSEFRAAVFKKNGTNDYTVAFKGTTMTSVSDWQANLGQGSAGYSNYYTRAKSIARRSTAMMGPGGASSVKFVGHSLGGGLASAAAHATGAPATTFNAAGLHIANRNIFHPAPIDAVRVNGEVLTGLQSAARPIPILLPSAAGTPYRIDPAPSSPSLLERADFSRWYHYIPGVAALKFGKAMITRAVDLHLMSSVNPALEAREDAVKKQANASGCRC